MGVERALAVFKAYLYLGRRVLERVRAPRTKASLCPWPAGGSLPLHTPVFSFVK